MKAWKDYVRYNRNLMLVNMSAIQFVNSNTRMLMKNCLDELKRNKEVKKHRLMKHAIVQDMDPALYSLNRFNENQADSYLAKGKLRAVKTVNEALSRVLYSYLKQWMKLSGHYKNNLMSRFGNRIVKNYYNNLNAGFVRWRRQIRKRDQDLT